MFCKPFDKMIDLKFAVQFLVQYEKNEKMKKQGKPLPIQTLR